MNIPTFLRSLFLLLPFLQTVHAQYFYQITGDPLINEGATCVIEAPDGNLFIGGYSGTNAVLIKSDVNGNFIWAKTFENPGVDRQAIHQIAITPDNYIIGVGNSIRPVAPPRDNGFYFKMDLNGNLIWRKDEMHAENGYFQEIRPVSATEYIVATCIYYQVGSYADVQLNKVDATTGTVLVNTPRFNLGPIPYIDDVEGFSFDANLRPILAGRVYVNGGAADGMRPYLMQFDANMNLIWSKYYLYPANASARLYGNDAYYDNSGIISMYYGDRFSGSPDFTVGLFKTDSLGNILWAVDYDILGSISEYSFHMISTPTGYAIYGPVSTGDLFFIFTDKQGNLVWAKTFGDPGLTEGIDYWGDPIIFTQNSFFIVAKTTGANQDFVIGRMDTLGNFTCYNTTIPNITVTPFAPTQTIINPAAVNDPLPFTSFPQITPYVFPPACNQLQQPNLGNDTTICSSLLLDGTTPGATSYLWQDGSTNPQFNVTVAGTYIVTASSGCCMKSDTIVIGYSTATPFNLGNDTTVCPQTNILLDPGLSGMTYNWNTGWTNQTLNVTQPGTYILTVTDPFGCISADTINIANFNIAAVTIGPVNNQCITGNSFSFSVSGVTDPSATYSWSFIPGGVPAFSNSDNPTGISFNTPGTKFAILSCTQYGCTSIDTLTFVVTPQPNPAFAATTGPQCFLNNAYNFVPTGNNPPGTSYDWTFSNATPSTSNVQNPTTSFNSPGTFPVTLIITSFGCSDTLTQNIIVNPNPVVDAGLNVSFCEGEGGVMLNGVGTGGTTPYYWTWWCDSTNTWCGLDSVFDNDPIANPNVSAMYYVQITDFNGCVSAVDSAFVTINPKPIVNAGPDRWICSQPAPGALLSPSITNSPGPFTFDWTPGSGLNDSTLMNPYARPDTTTIYIFVVTDVGTGCTSDVNTLDTNSTVTVHVKPLPIANAGPDRDLCYNDSIMLQGIGYGAGPGYSFEWSPAYGLNDSTLANPTATTPLTTDYVLTVWSNGCPSIGDTMTVNVHVLPTVDAGSDVDICLFDAGQLHATASGDSTTAFYEFTWVPASGLNYDSIPDPLASPSFTTQYYVQSSTEYGCKSPLDSVLLTIKPTPFAEAGPNISVCSGQSVQLSGSYFYQTPDTANPSQVWMSWYPNQFINDTTIANPVVNPSQTQYYYFGIQYNTCFTLDSVLVTVMPSPGAYATADTNTFCEGDSVQLFGSGGLGNANFTWIPSTGLSNPNVFNPWATPQDTTTYMLVVEEGGCSDTTEYTLNPIDGPQVSYLASNPVGCVPFDVSFLELLAAAEFYTWSFGDGFISNEHNPIHTYTTPGDYPVLLTAWNTGSCKSTLETMTIVVKDTAYANFVSDPMWPTRMTLPEANVKFTDHSLNAWSWTWTFDDGLQSGEKNPVHNFLQEGEYYVTLSVTNEVGCVSEIIHGPYIVVAPTVFIPNVFTPNDDKVNDEFLVRYTGDQPFLMQTFDRWGNLLYETRDKYAGWDGKYKGAKTPDGVYYYVVKIGEKGYSGNVTLLR